MKNKWIVHVTYGDPNSLLPLTTAIGLFDSQTQAQQFAYATYQGTNYVATVTPLNIIDWEANELPEIDTTEQEGKEIYSGAYEPEDQSTNEEK
tara:strand:- start:12596 stop:12874 length:279 start_codon:yes stop_codon:yes gene_type:complete